MEYINIRRADVRRLAGSTNLSLRSIKPSYAERRKGQEKRFFIFS